MRKNERKLLNLIKESNKLNLTAIREGATLDTSRKIRMNRRARIQLATALKESK